MSFAFQRSGKNLIGAATFTTNQVADTALFTTAASTAENTYRLVPVEVIISSNTAGVKWIYMGTNQNHTGQIAMYGVDPSDPTTQILMGSYNGSPAVSTTFRSFEWNFDIGPLRLTAADFLGHYTHRGNSGAGSAMKIVADVSLGVPFSIFAHVKKFGFN